MQKLPDLYPYDDPHRPRYPVPQEVIDGALIRMKNAARGNGIDPNSIVMTFFEGESFYFGARSIFKITPRVAEKIIAGRDSHGDVCGSVDHLRLRIRQTVENTHYDRNIVQYASDILDKRPDKGFAVNDIVIKFERLNKTLIAHHSCSNCTAGHLACGTCGGSRVQPCTRCHGQSRVPCPQCRGRGTITQQGKDQPCRKCSGQKNVRCTACQGQGRAPCRNCNGSGQAQCPRCNGSGFMSTIAYVTFEGKSHCTFDDIPLPPELPEIILRVGPELASAQHADVTILREEAHDEAQKTYETSEKPRENDELIVPYAVRLPYGTIRFRIGDGPEIEGKLFGQHPRLLNLPPFLEAPLAPALGRLDQAAARAGPVRRNIEEAIRYRAVADAMLAAATQPPKKAARLMHKKWSLGLRHETTDQMVLMADRAFANLAILPRTLGLAGGLGLAACLAWGWLGAARATLAAAVPEMALIAGDVLIVAAGAGVALLAVQYMTRFWVASVFRPILPKPKPGKKPVQILPRAGKGITAGAWFGSLAGFILVLLLLAKGGQPIPHWAFSALGWLHPLFT